jgi:D-arabinose 1-dehydrogenase-like Zn-dependent alcohol dehydrogenase
VYVNQCERLKEIDFRLDGGFAEYLVAEEKFCFKVNEFASIYGTKERDLEIAALING